MDRSIQAPSRRMHELDSKRSSSPRPAEWLGLISCSGCSKSTRSVARHVGVGCGSFRRSPSPTWRVGFWNGSTCRRGLRLSANQKGCPAGFRAKSRHPTCPGTTTLASTSTSLIHRTVDRRRLNRERGPIDASGPDGVDECRSIRRGRVHSLVLATAIPRAFGRRGSPRVRQSLKSPQEGA